MARRDGTLSLIDQATGETLYERSGELPLSRVIYDSGRWAAVAVRNIDYLEPEDSPFGYHTEVPAQSLVTIVRSRDHTLAAVLQLSGRVSDVTLASDIEAAAHLARAPTALGAA